MKTSQTYQKPECKFEEGCFPTEKSTRSFDVEDFILSRTPWHKIADLLQQAEIDALRLRKLDRATQERKAS